MAYAKTLWADREGTHFNRYAKSEETPTSVVLTNTPNITKPGTPFNVEDMNKIEEGIFAAHQAIDNHVAAEPFGYLISFAMQPSEAEMIAWGCLPLMGGVYEIAKYQRLFNKMYVGNAANATADWWYRASDPQGNVRDVNGAYFRALDHRGVFSRPAGQNSKYKMANDAPYDGMAIGAAILDAVQTEAADISLRLFDGGNGDLIIGGGPFFNYRSDGTFGHAVVARGSGIEGAFGRMNFDIGNISGMRSARETRPASISSYFCIKY